MISQMKKGTPINAVTMPIGKIAPRNDDLRCDGITKESRS